MKTVTFNRLKNLGNLKLLQFCFIFLFVNAAFAQVQNNGKLYVEDNGFVFIGSNSYNFGSGITQTTTSRTPLTRGKLIFSGTATSSGATSSHYLDGYAGVRSTTPFLLPVGQSFVYAPARVTAATLTQIDAAFYFQNPISLGVSLDPNLKLISEREYWNIEGNNSAIISLTWRPNSIIANVVQNTSDLTIAGYDGLKWVEIPSLVDPISILGGTSTVSAGSITTVSAIDLTVYKYFTFACKSGTCSPLTVFSGNTKTWNGVWTPSAPTLSDNVVINSAYSAGSFSCNSLIINADITLNNSENVEVINGVTGIGKIIMSSEASFVQRNPSAVGPNIELTKRTRSLMHRYDYIYWGTPIAGNFFSQIAEAQAGISGIAGAFDAYYRYLSGSGGGWRALTTIETGKGFITRIKAQTPFTNSTNTDFINFKFTGFANNGDIIIPITNNPADLNGATSHVLLANPYPSAIDADIFLSQNTDIDGVVYIWTAATVNDGIGTPYSQADYIAYTRAGFVAPSPIVASFNGKIASAQGFKVKSLTNSGNVTFTNCMRLLANNNNFYKLKQPISNSINRFKLNMTGNNGVFSQILIAYLPNCSLGYDRMYDAGRNSVSTAQLYSFLDKDNLKLAINARPELDLNDIVSIGVSKTTTTSEEFTVTINEKEGVFADGSVPVYLYDGLLNIYHDLNKGAYTFYSNENELNNRFKIVYTNKTLGTTDFVSNSNKLIATINKQTLNISASLPMTNLSIYDVSGRLLTEMNINRQREITNPFRFGSGIYIVKITLENGEIVNVKLISSNK